MPRSTTASSGSCRSEPRRSARAVLRALTALAGLLASCAPALEPHTRAEGTARDAAPVGDARSTRGAEGEGREDRPFKAPTGLGMIDLTRWIYDRVESTEEKREAKLRAQTRTDYVLFQQERGEYSGLTRLWPVYTYRFDTRPQQTTHNLFLWPGLSGLGWGDRYSDVHLLLLARFRSKRAGNERGHIAHILYTGSLHQARKDKKSELRCWGCIPLATGCLRYTEEEGDDIRAWGVLAVPLLSSLGPWHFSRRSAAGDRFRVTSGLGVFASDEQRTVPAVSAAAEGEPAAKPLSIRRRVYGCYPLLSGVTVSSASDDSRDVAVLCVPLMTFYARRRAAKRRRHSSFFSAPLLTSIRPGRADVLWPIFHSSRDGDRRSLRIFPLVWWRRDGDRSATTILPLLLRHERQGTRRCLRLLYLLKIPLSS